MLTETIVGTIILTTQIIVWREAHCIAVHIVEAVITTPVAHTEILVAMLEVAMIIVMMVFWSECMSAEVLLCCAS